MTSPEEILELEHAFWQTMIDNDTETAIRLTDDPCIVAGAQGTSKIDHPTFRKLMTAPSWKLLRYEFKNAQVYFPAENVAIASYEVHEELTVEGSPLQFDAADTSVWIRKADRWVCSLHTESVRGDPFGRDHK